MRHGNLNARKLTKQNKYNKQLNNKKEKGKEKL